MNINSYNNNNYLFNQNPNDSINCNNNLNGKKIQIQYINHDINVNNIKI